MLKIYRSDPAGLRPAELGAGRHLPAGTVWIDLFAPDLAEEKLAEELIGTSIPTREEQREIEISSRLYDEEGTLFMSATVLTRADTEMPETSVVTFILSPKVLTTLRYADPTPFRVYTAHAERHGHACTDSLHVLTGLIEAIVDRLADVLERTGLEIDEISRVIFAPHQGKHYSRDLQNIMRRIGRQGDMTSKIQEALISLSRLVAYLTAQTDRAPKEIRARIKSAARDISSLSDHVSYTTAKINFLLDATLGMINLDQNNIIKVVSIVSLVFMPPTMVASIYGMNFHRMPELDWAWGYPMALVIMLIFALGPYLYFKMKNWL